MFSDTSRDVVDDVDLIYKCSSRVRSMAGFGRSSVSTVFGDSVGDPDVTQPPDADYTAIGRHFDPSNPNMWAQCTLLHIETLSVTGVFNSCITHIK